MDLRLRARRAADLLIHDCQYSDEEYPSHVGWGHSRLSDALAFARRVEPDRLMLFHHDPMHSDDFLDAFHGTAIERWAEIGGRPAQIALATERRELELTGLSPTPSRRAEALGSAECARIALSRSTRLGRVRPDCSGPKHSARPSAPGLLWAEALGSAECARIALGRSTRLGRVRPDCSQEGSARPS